MKTKQLAREWIKSVPDIEIDELIEGLQGSEGMVTATKLYEAIDDERWKRHSQPLTNWPTIIWDSRIKVIVFCHDIEEDMFAVDFGRSIAKHQPIRQLKRVLTASGRIDSPSGFHGLVLQEQAYQLECSCGKRFSPSSGRHCRSPSCASGWPVTIKGKHYACRRMKITDGEATDPLFEHGRLETRKRGEYRCLCSPYSYAEDGNLVEVK